MLITPTSCDVDTTTPLTPSECREYGVNVADDDTITGTIIRSEFTTIGGVYRECGRTGSGCAVPASGEKIWPSPDHKYNIFYAERKCAPHHEACHARYEEWNHTIAFNLRIFQGDKLAACPP